MHSIQFTVIPLLSFCCLGFGFFIPKTAYDPHNNIYLPNTPADEIVQDDATKQQNIAALNKFWPGRQALYSALESVESQSSDKDHKPGSTESQPAQETITPNEETLLRSMDQDSIRNSEEGINDFNIFNLNHIFHPVFGELTGEKSQSSNEDHKLSSSEPHPILETIRPNEETSERSMDKDTVWNSDPMVEEEKTNHDLKFLESIFGKNLFSRPDNQNHYELIDEKSQPSSEDDKLSSSDPQPAQETITSNEETLLRSIDKDSVRDSEEGIDHLNIFDLNNFFHSAFDELRDEKSQSSNGDHKLSSSEPHPILETIRPNGETPERTMDKDSVWNSDPMVEEEKTDHDLKFLDSVFGQNLFSRPDNHYHYELVGEKSQSSSEDDKLSSNESQLNQETITPNEEASVIINMDNDSVWNSDSMFEGEKNDDNLKFVDSIFDQNLFSRPNYEKHDEHPVFNELQPFPHTLVLCKMTANWVVVCNPLDSSNHFDDTTYLNSGMKVLKFNQNEVHFPTPLNSFYPHIVPRWHHQMPQNNLYHPFLTINNYYTTIPNNPYYEYLMKNNAF